MEEDNILVMYFENPEFNDGINLTVRRGTKWDQFRGDMYLQGVEKESPNNVGTIIETKVMRFEDIQKEDLELEHDSRCRDYEGLLECMREVYDDFDVYEIVTLVYFKVYE